MRTRKWVNERYPSASQRLGATRSESPLYTTAQSTQLNVLSAHQYLTRCNNLLRGLHSTERQFWNMASSGLSKEAGHH